MNQLSRCFSLNYPNKKPATTPLQPCFSLKDFPWFSPDPEFLSRTTTHCWVATYMKWEVGSDWHVASFHISNPIKSFKWVFFSAAFFRPHGVKPRSLWTEIWTTKDDTMNKHQTLLSGVCIFFHLGICFCITGVSPMQFLRCFVLRRWWNSFPWSMTSPWTLWRIFRLASGRCFRAGSQTAKKKSKCVKRWPKRPCVERDQA